MPYLNRAGLTENYRNNIEPARPIRYLIRRHKITCHAGQLVLFGLRDDRLHRLKILLSSGLYLDKNNGPAAVDHNQIDFPRLAGVIIRQPPEALFFKEDFAAPLTPSAEQFAVSQQFLSVQH